MPVARTADPATSHAAARAAHNPNEVQARILTILTDHASGPDAAGISDEGIYALYRAKARRLGWVIPTEQSIRSRRHELELADKVYFTDDHGTTKAGNKTRLWKAATT